MKETKRQRELRLLRNQIKRLELQREQAIRMLVRAEVELPGLLKRFRRLDMQRLKLCGRPVSGLTEAKDAPPVPVAHVAEDRSKGDDPVTVQDNAGAIPRAGDLNDPGPVPTFLRRGMAAQAAVDAVLKREFPASEVLDPEVAAAAYAVANAHNKIPTEEQKKLVATEKRKVRDEHKHAELTGQRRKAPLTGRAAEAFLRQRGR
jgi:hypothetical protein